MLTGERDHKYIWQMSYVKPPHINELPLYPHLSPLVSAVLVLDERVALDQEEGELLGLDGSGDASADVVEDVLPGDVGAVAGNL